MPTTLLRSALLLACAAVCAAQTTCATWCNRWTCSNTNYCGGCDASICRGQNPHPMCNDPVQPHCFAPRCEHFCTPADPCSRAECSGCNSCLGPQASPLAAPGEVLEGEQGKRRTKSVDKPAPACDIAYLEQTKAELQSMVDQQMARNLELRRAVSPGEKHDSLPPAAPSVPPLPPSPPSPSPPPCVAAGHQCGGSQWTGPSTCCQADGAPTRICRWFSDSFSGCREVTI